MKDSTKHIIAKEIYFFFKWCVRGFGLGIILGFLSIPLVRYFTGDTHTPWFAIVGAITLCTIYISVICIYLFRFVTWVVQWVNKWK